MQITTWIDGSISQMRRDRLHAVPAGRHAHIDKGHRVGASCRRSSARPCRGLPCPGRRSRARSPPAPRRRAVAPKNSAITLSSAPLAGAAGAEDLAEVGMDLGIVVDDEDAVVAGRGGRGIHGQKKWQAQAATATGMRIVGSGGRGRRWRRCRGRRCGRRARRPSRWRRARCCAGRSRGRSSSW